MNDEFGPGNLRGGGGIGPRISIASDEAAACFAAGRHFRSAFRFVSCRGPGYPHRSFLAFDHAHLACLNVVEKFNCAYCSYANGLASYIKEVVGRTEQYWCPLKHARRVLHAHPYYAGFTDYGDAEAYRRDLQTLRKELAQIEKTGAQA